MTTLTLSNPLSRALVLFARLFHRDRPPVVLSDGRSIDHATLHQIRELPPHLLKDIGLTDF